MNKENLMSEIVKKNQNNKRNEKGNSLLLHTLAHLFKKKIFKLPTWGKK